MTRGVKLRYELVVTDSDYRNKRYRFHICIGRSSDLLFVLTTCMLLCISKCVLFFHPHNKWQKQNNTTLKECDSMHQLSVQLILKHLVYIVSTTQNGRLVSVTIEQQTTLMLHCSYKVSKKYKQKQTKIKICQTKRNTSKRGFKTSFFIVSKKVKKRLLLQWIDAFFICVKCFKSYCNHWLYDYTQCITYLLILYLQWIEYCLHYNK